MRKTKKILGILCFMLAVLLPAACEMKAEAADNLIVVLDPGHDNSDIGARRTWDGVTYAEETICLKIAQYCKAALEQYQGITVYLTRNTNAVSMDRYARLTYAKSVNADVLVSLHCNSWTDASVSYVSAYAPTPSNTKAYAKTARGLATAITTQLSQNLGIKYNGLMVDEGLGIIAYGKQYKIPSMIIEHDFISNKAACQRLFHTEAQLKKVGETDALGIAKYYGLTKTPLATGWQTNGTYVTSSGTKATGWLTDSGKRYYLDANGLRVTGWQTLDGKKYYFNTDGSLATGLLNLKGKLYWMGAKGILQTGFTNGYDGNRYYSSKKGILYKGFKKYKGKSYYFDPLTGAAKKGLMILNGKYYFFNAKGVRKTGFVKIEDNYYYLTTAGKRVTSTWVKKSGKWYYLRKSGARAQSTTLRLKGVYYTFNEKGVCLNKN